MTKGNAYGIMAAARFATQTFGYAATALHAAAPLNHSIKMPLQASIFICDIIMWKQLVLSQKEMEN